MTADQVAAILDFATTALLGITLILLVAARRGFSRVAFCLLLGLLVFGMFLGEDSVLYLIGLAPQAEAMEDFLMPLIPVLWLFLFVVELERADRERLERELAQTMAVHSLASKLALTMEPVQVLDEAVEAAARLLDAPYVAIYIPDENGRLTARACRGVDPGEMRTLGMAPGEGIAGRAFRDRKPCRTSDARREAAPAAMPVVERAGIRYMAGIPLLVRGEAIGALSVGRKTAAFDDSEAALLETLCAHAAAAVENARLFERIRESEEKYRLLVENAQVAIVVADASRHITFWNRGAGQLFGWSPREAIGRHISFIYPPDRLDDADREVLGGLNREGAWFGEFPLVRKSGAQFTGFMSLARVFDAGGKVLCTLGVLLDVTERSELREQLIQAQKMETVGTLSGGLAHDFNNLLTAILGFTDLLKMSLAPGSEDYDAAANIEHAANRGTQLVRQLMAFSHRQPTKAEPVDLNEVVGETCDLIRRTFPRTIEVATLLDPGLRLIRGDSTQMHQVIMNLAINARDAMPKGGTLTIATENIDLAADDLRAAGLKPGPWVCLSVTDTGAGIPPEVKSHIFEPFFTTKPKTGGTGLGLSTAYAIVMRHHGRITFKSRVGQGTTFTVFVPAMAPHPATSDAPASPQPTQVL